MKYAVFLFLLSMLFLKLNILYLYIVCDPEFRSSRHRHQFIVFSFAFNNI